MRIVFAGTPEFAVPALHALHAAGHELCAVYTQPDRPAGRGRQLAASPVKQRAQALSIPVEQPASLRDAAAQAALAAYRPDLMVVVAYGLILPQAVLDIPRLGCLNIHASRLPRWRGAAPIQRAILAGDSVTGVTIMKMDAGLDTGPMLLLREAAIGQRETAGELHDRLAGIGGQAIVEAIEAWSAGRIVPVAQPTEGVTYAAKISKDESLVDWNSSAGQIDRQVRAFNPWPVAETRWRGRQLRIWAAEPVACAAAGEPGTILEATRSGLVVATGEGCLALLQLQLPGGKPMNYKDLINAQEFSGARLGA